MYCSMTDRIITNATTCDGSSVDVAIEDGTITRVEDGGSIDPEVVPADRRYDADGRLVTPP